MFRVSHGNRNCGTRGEREAEDEGCADVGRNGDGDDDEDGDDDGDDGDGVDDDDDDAAGCDDDDDGDDDDDDGADGPAKRPRLSVYSATVFIIMRPSSMWLKWRNPGRLLKWHKPDSNKRCMT